MQKISTTKKSTVFYGWFALAGLIPVTLIVGGSFVNAFGVLLPVLSDQFSWSRAEVSMALSFGIAAFGLPSMFFGIAVNKLGSRFTIVLGNLLVAVGMVALYFVNGLWQLYLIYIFIGFTAGFGGYVSATTLLNNWFIKKRAMVMSIFTASAGAGGLILPPLATILVKSYGWREAWLILAALVTVATILSWLVIRNRPEDKGQLPEGYSSLTVSDSKESTLLAGNGTGWKFSSIFKVPVTYLILAFVVANAFIMGSINSHQIAYVQDIGFSAMTGATTMSVFSILQLIGSLSFGTLALKINIRHLAFAGLIFEFIGIIIMLSTKNISLLYVYSGIIGFGVGALFTAMPSFIGAYFPREHYAQITGIFLPFHVVSQAIIAWVVGKIFDVTGSYSLAFTGLAVLALLGSACALLARPPKKAI
jgi:MFS family permease